MLRLAFLNEISDTALSVSFCEELACSEAAFSCKTSDTGGFLVKTDFSDKEVFNCPNFIPVLEKIFDFFKNS